MTLNELRRSVCEANIALSRNGLAPFTWGNASGIDRKSGLVVIKPSGVEYEKLTPDDMVLVELKTGRAAEGSLRPSSDTPTHIELYRRFPQIGGVAHTHSHWATVFAQVKRAIPPLGTTHADHFYGEIPCTRDMTDAEINSDYEAETGRLIADWFTERNIEPRDVPAVLVAGHGPFTWGEDAFDAVHNSAVLEIVAEMAWHTLVLSGGEPENISRALLDRHYFRKHGSGAYYGQPEGK